MNVYIGGTKNYSAMQGPCPSGFHVPTKDDWKGVKSIMDGLSLGAKYVEYLHMPLAGYRDFGSSNAINKNDFGYYWTTFPNGSINWEARYFAVYSSSGSLDHYLRSCGMSIRPFKNEFVKPGSGWTTIYGAGSAGIFWDTTNGLISITGDGNTGYTIADKNLGASTVWSSGNGLYESNCGKYYQWGNNYGFPFTGSVTTSSTRVDASSYGPSNYYNSSTFIITASNADWSTVRNDNLWGYETPGPMKNAYIGEYIPNFATQGPCPNGFHVPLKSEWEGVKTIVDGMSLTASGWGIYLHLPLAGRRAQYYSATIYNQGDSGFYWSSNAEVEPDSYCLYLTSSSIYPSFDLCKSGGQSIRPFRNKFATPTSSWIASYGTLGSAGIFWDTVNGLISITGDGVTGYTISDKNLGATTVYYDGDTISEANCGKYYQWGNNYGFAWTGSITGVNSPINASSYGPGNYYSSSTYRANNGNSWDSSANANLWGGVDGNVPVE